MPSALAKILGRRGSNTSTTSVNSVDSDESFHCCGIPDDFYDPKFDSEEEIARRLRREEISRRAVYTGYEHTTRIPKAHPLTKLNSKDPMLKIITKRKDRVPKMPSSKRDNLRRKLAHRRVRFHAGFGSRLADNFPQFPIETNDEVETINERALSTSRSESSLRESRFMFQKPRLLGNGKMKKK